GRAVRGLGGGVGGGLVLGGGPVGGGRGLGRGVRLDGLGGGLVLRGLVLGGLVLGAVGLPAAALLRGAPPGRGALGGLEQHRGPGVGGPGLLGGLLRRRLGRLDGRFGRLLGGLGRRILRRALLRGGLLGLGLLRPLGGLLGRGGLGDRRLRC